MNQEENEGLIKLLNKIDGVLKIREYQKSIKQEDKSFGCFARKDILDLMYPTLGGTTWHNKELERLQNS